MKGRAEFIDLKKPISLWQFWTLFWSFYRKSSDLLYSRDRILERHFLSRFLGINSILLRLEFSTLIFPFYKMLFMNRLEFSCFANFFVWIFKTRIEYGFLKTPPVERLWITWNKRLESFVKLLSKNSISVHFSSYIKKSTFVS